MLKSSFGVDAKVLTGSISAEKRKRLLDELRQGESRVLVATCQLIGEGFDLPEIESVFLTTPISYHGRLIQYIGRALRPTPGKAKAILYDFVDVQDPVFRSQALARERTYDSQGIACSAPFDEDDIDRDAAWCYDEGYLGCN
jgi:superfamily II DNA or RNA helicase